MTRKASSSTAVAAASAPASTALASLARLASKHPAKPSTAKVKLALNQSYDVVVLDVQKATNRNGRERLVLTLDFSQFTGTVYYRSVMLEEASDLRHAFRPAIVAFNDAQTVPEARIDRASALSALATMSSDELLSLFTDAYLGRTVTVFAKPSGDPEYPFFLNFVAIKK